MKTSDSIKEIGAALAKAQGMVEGARKDSTNPHYKSKYADLASTWDACRDALTTNGLAVVQMTDVSDKDEVIVETRLIHCSGEWIEGRLALPVSKIDAQGYGSALTYARRYGLAAAVGVAPADDDGNAAAAARPDVAGRILSGNGKANAEGEEILNAMPHDERQFLRDEAIKIIAYFEGDGLPQVAEDAAAAYVLGANYQLEEKMALWTLLPSHVRSGVKRGLARIQIERSVSQPQLASQA